MRVILEKSFFRRIIAMAYFFVLFAFEKSVLKRALLKLSFIFKNSKTRNVIMRYFDKKPLFFDSIFYRGIKALGKRMTKTADRINNGAAKIYDGSFLKKIVVFYDSENIKDKFAAIGIFFMVVSLSFLLFSIIFGRNQETRVVVSWIVFYLGFLIVYGGRGIEVVKKSVFYRIIKYIAELVRM